MKIVYIHESIAHKGGLERIFELFGRPVTV